MNFDDMSLHRLFGHEAAEDEDPARLKKYYFKHQIFKQIVVDLPLRVVVGHKGIGKSALFKVAIDEEESNNRLTVSIKPNDISNIGVTNEDFLKQIQEWKEGISKIICDKVLRSFNQYFDDSDSFRAKLNKYTGNFLCFLEETLTPLKEKYVNTEPTKAAILNDFLESKKISVYIDDLDRGWQGRKTDIQRISALLNAVRDISSELRGIYFRISLRSDVYYLVRTSDESTDKVEGAVRWYSWTNHEILVMLIKRVESFFGREVDEEELLRKHQSALMKYLNPVMEEYFTGAGHWNNVPMYRVLMSLVRKRPRDLVKLLTLAGRVAKTGKISTKHLESVFEEYSQGRLQDTINEYKSELPDIERLLLGMKPSKKEKTAAEGYVYTTDRLQKKLHDITQGGVFRLNNGGVADVKSLANFLYKINFITARKESPNGIDRKFFEESRYLSSKFADFGYDWEIHPAYRWALQPDSLKTIFLELELSQDS